MSATFLTLDILRVPRKVLKGFVLLSKGSNILSLREILASRSFSASNC